MRTSMRLGRVLGIELRLDRSIVVIFGLLAWQLSTLALPTMAPGYSSAAYWSVGVVTTAAFLVSLAAHELSHSRMARRKGISVRDITLWMLGGIATIEGTAHTPRDDFEIAIVGPATSAVIGVAGIAAGITGAAISAPRILVGSVAWLSMINLLLAVFNLAPAAPLDGGRILRAWLWHRSGDRTTAAVKAAHAGRVFAWVLIAAGLAELAATGEIGGLWFILLGWFVFNAARAEEIQELRAREQPRADRTREAA